VKKNKSEDVGRYVALTFDYGVVQSEKLGNGAVRGSVLCFETYEDKQAILDEETYSTTTFCDVASALLEDLERIGGKFDPNHEKLRGFEAHGCEIADGLAIFFPSIPVEETKAAMLTTAITGQIDDGFEQAVAEKRSLEPVLRAYRGALKGEYTNLNQIDLACIPDYLHNSIGMCILLRKEVLRKTKSEETWTFLENDFLDYLYANSVEHVQSTSVEDYLNLREHTGAVRLSLEISWIIPGIRIPEEVRSHPDFHTFKSLLSRYGALHNDVVALRREVEKGEFNNLVILLAQNMPLQTAITESLRIMESMFYKIKDAARGLIKTFERYEGLEGVVQSAGRCIDCLARSSEKYFDRYGLEENSHYDIVEFSESYMMKERETEGILLNLKLNGQIISADRNGDALKNGPVSNPKAGSPVAKRKLKISTNCVDQNVADTKIPKHVAIIPDGNRRWAESKGLEPWKGHAATCLSAKDLLCELLDRGVHSVTVWGLSPDNFKRPKRELDFLWFQFEKFAVSVRETCAEYDARFCHIGKVERIPARTMRIMRLLEKETRDRTSHCVMLALDYGGIEEVVQAVSKVEGDVSAEGITEHLYASTKNVLYPKPDLVVRTGSKDAGTVRISGFMIWQAAQAEYFFEDKYMPDVTSADVSRWLEAFAQSDQRLGK